MGCRRTAQGGRRRRNHKRLRLPSANFDARPECSRRCRGVWTKRSTTVTRLCEGTSWYGGGPSNLTVVLSQRAHLPTQLLSPVRSAIWQPENKHHGHWPARITWGCGEIEDLPP